MWNRVYRSLLKAAPSPNFPNLVKGTTFLRIALKRCFSASAVLAFEAGYFLVVGGFPVHCMMLSINLHNGIIYTIPVVTIKNIFRHWKMFCGGKMALNWESLPYSEIPESPFSSPSSLFILVSLNTASVTKFCYFCLCNVSCIHPCVYIVLPNTCPSLFLRGFPCPWHLLLPTCPTHLCQLNLLIHHDTYLLKPLKQLPVAYWIHFELSETV